MTRRSYRFGVAGMLAFALLHQPAAAELASVDATRVAPAPRSEHLHMGTGTGPHGVIGANSRYLTRDGRPWLPVMGEFHFSRFPASGWEEEILKMKAAGVSIVATYVIWNQIELEPGKLDWTGDRDLRRFAELCAKHDMLLFVRPGPWAHAETRFGGIPDWIVSSTRPRSDDPAYLAQVQRFWGGIADQLKGQLWKDGGAVVGLQIENEYNLEGPGQGRAHIATLKAMAVKLGLDVPLYTVTGWDHTVYPRGEVLPVQGGYPDEPWSAKTVKLPPKENYLFRFHSRVSGDLGAQTRATKRGDADDDNEDTPFLGAEYGGGVPVMYRRRPLLAPADVGAAVTTQVGSGVNMLGYYMFHGGANPLAHGRTLEETQRSGGYNDVPAIGYDFQAPIGQYGEVNPVSGAIRPLHYLLAAYGDRLATMIPHEPAVAISDPADLKTLRWSLRSEGDAGFLFVNDHIRQYAMAPHKDVRFDLRLPSGTMRIPSTGIAIADGASFIWPVNLDLDGIRLAWATAQPVTRLSDRAGPIHVLLATQPGPVELAFAADGVTSVSVPTKRDEAGRLIARVMPAPNRFVTIAKADGTKVRILLLDASSAGRIWVGDAAGTRRLVLTDADVFFERGGLVLRQRGMQKFRFSMWPQANASSANATLTRTSGEAMEASIVGSLPGTLPVMPERAPSDAPPVEIGGPAKAAMQPLAEAHRADGTWSFTVPREALRGVEDAYLEIDYRGDIGRLNDGATMLDDAFWDGRVWRIGLKRFADRIGHPWTLAVTPLRADAPIYLDETARALLPKAAQVAEVRSIRLVPEYELRVTLR
jgi:beta-galactosidase